MEQCQAPPLLLRLNTHQVASCFLQEQHLPIQPEWLFEVLPA